MKSRIKLNDAFLGGLPEEMQEGLAKIIAEAEIEEPEVRRRATTHKFALSKTDERTAINYISTRTIDRDKEIIVPDGVDLREFRKNPVLLFGHNWSEPPIGSDSAVKSDGFGILAKSQFAETAFASDIWSLVKDQHLRTSSIGFMPVEFVKNGTPAFDDLVDMLSATWKELTKKAARELRGFITKSVLIEHSIVTIPSNRESLVLAVSEKSLDLTADTLEKMGIECEIVEDLFEGFKYDDDLETVEVKSLENSGKTGKGKSGDAGRENADNPLDNSQEVNTIIQDGDAEKTKPRLIARLVKSADSRKVPIQKDLEMMAEKAIRNEKDRLSGKV